MLIIVGEKMTNNVLNSMYGIFYVIVESVILLIILTTYPWLLDRIPKSVMFGAFEMFLFVTIIIKVPLFLIIYLFTFIHFNIIRLYIRESYIKILLIHCIVYCIATAILSIIFPLLGALYYKPINILISISVVIILSSLYNKSFNVIFSRYYSDFIPEELDDGVS